MEETVKESGNRKRVDIMVEDYFDQLERKIYGFINETKDKHKIRGEFQTGVRSYLSDADNKFICSIENGISAEEALKRIDSIPNSSVFLSSSSKFCLRNSVPVCNIGARKFYYPVSEDKGLYVFSSMHKKNKCRYSTVFIKNYVRVSSYYEKLDMFPKIYGWCYVDADCHIKSDNGNFRLKDELIFTMITERLYPPSYKLNLKKDIHRDVFKRVWNNKKIKPYHLSKDYLNSIYWETFCDDHPDFNEMSRNKFCKRIRSLYKKNKYHQKLRNRGHKKKGIHSDPNLKYGNVVYCTKRKQWFYIDME